jgi:hypothetical protein
MDTDERLATTLAARQRLVQLTPSGPGCSIVTLSSWSVRQISSRAA